MSRTCIENARACLRCPKCMYVYSFGVDLQQPLRVPLAALSDCTAPRPLQYATLSTFMALVTLAQLVNQVFIQYEESLRT